MGSSRQRAHVTWAEAAQRGSLAANAAAVEMGIQASRQGNHRDLRVT
ncbi:hypothetical protein TOK_4565 [Pseudonocardia sp. N23]|nr:hypothetical protein TOK_4565 [Pseudonocardia sp. N23]